MTFFGTFFSIQANIITILEAEQPGRQSEGNFNRGFSTKTYPAIYLPNIIPASHKGLHTVAHVGMRLGDAVHGMY